MWRAPAVRPPRSQWLLSAVVLMGVELVVVGGSTATSHQAGKLPLDVLGYGLLALAGGSVVVSRRWPVAAFGLALASILLYAGFGYPTDGPVFLVVPVTLYSTVRLDEPWRAIVFAGLASLALFAAYGVLSGGMPLDVRVLMLPLWMMAVVGVAYLMAHRSREIEVLRQAEARRLVTEERLRIARELHDVVSHSISMINVQAGVAAHVLDQQPEQAREALLAIKGASKEALRELRGILGVLREVDGVESRLPAPSLAQLPVLVETTTRAGLRTTICVTGEPRRLPPTLDLTAYRIVQEALTNALRYAGPATASVEIGYSDACLTVMVTDDGRGSPEVAVGTGNGLAGMRERAAAVGGELEAGPLPGRGFRVAAHLPLAGEAVP